MLRGDMVFVPDQPWKAAWLGLDGRVPRFVPGDAFVSAARHRCSPATWCRRACCCGASSCAGSASAAGSRRTAVMARAAAITFYLWNPWVYERLAIGQWGVVVGYALLPWWSSPPSGCGTASLRAWRALVGWLGLAAVFSPASGLVALAVAVAVLPRAVGTARAVGAPSVAGSRGQPPWIVPSLLTAPHHGGVRPVRGVRAAGRVRARACSASVLSLGGIWKSERRCRASAGARVVVVLSLLLTVVARRGAAARAAAEPAPVLGLGLLASARGVALVLVTAVPAGRHRRSRTSPRPSPPSACSATRTATSARSRWCSLSGIAGAVDWLWERARAGSGGAARRGRAPRGGARSLCLPSLAWGLGGTLRPVDYPAEWYAVRDPVPAGRTVVLPWRGQLPRLRVERPPCRARPGPAVLPGRRAGRRPDLLVGAQVLPSEDPLLRGVTAGPRRARPGRGAAPVSACGQRAGREGQRRCRRGLSGADVLHDGPGLTPASTSGRRSADRPGRLSASGR